MLNLSGFESIKKAFYITDKRQSSFRQGVWIGTQQITQLRKLKKKLKIKTKKEHG